MKEFIEKKGLGFWFVAAAVICDLLGCILFGVSRENVSTLAVVFLALAAVAGAVVVVKPFKFTEFVPFVLTAAATGLIAYVLIENISQIFFKNNVIGLSGTFVCSVVFVVLGMLASAAAIVLKQEKK